MLREDLDAPRKQRHTAQRVWDRLIDEHHLEVSYSTVRAYVARRRPEILARSADELVATLRSLQTRMKPGARTAFNRALADAEALAALLRGH